MSILKFQAACKKFTVPTHFPHAARRARASGAVRPASAVLPDTAAFESAAATACGFRRFRRRPPFSPARAAGFGNFYKNRRKRFRRQSRAGGEIPPPPGGAERGGSRERAPLPKGRQKEPPGRAAPPARAGARPFSAGRSGVRRSASIFGGVLRRLAERVNLWRGAPAFGGARPFSAGYSGVRRSASISGGALQRSAKRVSFRRGAPSCRCSRNTASRRCAPGSPRTAGAPA